MAEGICYVCNQSFTAAEKDTVVDTIVEQAQSNFLVI